LIVFNARTINEIVCRPHSDRLIIRDGERIAAKLPDYSELWDDDAPAGPGETRKPESSADADASTVA
jgi:hypothetical protein